MDEPYSPQRPQPILPHFSYEKLGSKPPNGSLFGIIGYELTLLLQACDHRAVAPSVHVVHRFCFFLILLREMDGNGSQALQVSQASSAIITFIPLPPSVTFILLSPPSVTVMLTVTLLPLTGTGRLGGLPCDRVCLCLLLQYLLESCSRWERGIVEDMCYERRRAEACMD